MFEDEENNHHNQMIIDTTINMVEDNDLYELKPLIRTKSFDMTKYFDYNAEWEIDLEAELDKDTWKMCIRERIVNTYNKKNSDSKIRYSKTRYSNDSGMFKNKNCFCCKNYLMIHICNFAYYIDKYKKENKTMVPKSSKNIQRLYRLKPELFNGIDISKIRYLNNINIGQINSPDAYVYRYENLMFNEKIIFNENNMVSTANVQCLICKKKFCDTHLEYNPMYNKKCSCCEKNWNICSWCLHDDFVEFVKDDKIDYEEDFCNVFHKGIIGNSTNL